MAGIVQAAQHPQELFNRIVQNNPQMQMVQQLQQVNQYVQQNGGNAESLFYAMAKQQNKDPEQIIQQAKEMMASYRK